MRKALFATLTIPWLTKAACITESYQTLMGGYTNFHGVNTITFDMNADTGDIVVGGSQDKNGFKEGFTYFLDNDDCEVKWMLRAAEASEVIDIAFSPVTSNYILGLTNYPVMIFWIDNSVPATVDSLEVFHMPDSIASPLSIHLKNTLSEALFLTYSQIVLAQPI